ncbi:MAG: hypothetical protein MUF42_08605 [Cytophagaceae bacterium]|jgi:hypothetical protein|nr:hypothetical protein [Cytophagaceae bacterium]
MKKNLLFFGLGVAVMSIFALFSFTNNKSASKGVTYLQVTTVESVVPGGLGRSRMITTDPSGNMQEVKMENFFSLAGINFQNVRDNDKMIADKITDLSNQGWELVQVNTGAYAGNEQGKITGGGVGIFITRYLFKKNG